MSSVSEQYSKYILPTYAFFNMTLSHGKGTYVWDTTGKKYLDFGGGIAVNSLGHSHPSLVSALTDQANKFFHVSNLYMHEQQANLGERLSTLMGGGKMFFCNSGAEANEGMYKLARMFGTQMASPGTKYKIITAINSFHGRTLAGIAATGQEKIKKGFYPIMEGFTHVPYNNLSAVANAIDDNTAAILIECIQGEGGIVKATPEYLFGLRQLCNENDLLLLMDGVQDGHYRTGSFQCYQRLIRDFDTDFAPDAISMAKSLGGGFPIGAFWVNSQHQEILTAGSHGSTFGGNPLGCAVANAILDVIQADRLENNVLEISKYLKSELRALCQKYPNVLKSIRGEGFLIGIEIGSTVSDSSNLTPAITFVSNLHQIGMLTVPAGETIVRLLPPLNTTKAEADESLTYIENIARKFSK